MDTYTWDGAAGLRCGITVAQIKEERCGVRFGDNSRGLALEDRERPPAHDGDDGTIMAASVTLLGAKRHTWFLTAPVDGEGSRILVHITTPTVNVVAGTPELGLGSLGALVVLTPGDAVETEHGRLALGVDGQPELGVASGVATGATTAGGATTLATASAAAGAAPAGAADMVQVTVGSGLDLVVVGGTPVITPRASTTCALLRAGDHVRVLDPQARVVDVNVGGAGTECSSATLLDLVHGALATLSERSPDEKDDLDAIRVLVDDAGGRILAATATAPATATVTAAASLAAAGSAAAASHQGAVLAPEAGALPEPGPATLPSAQQRLLSDLEAALTEDDSAVLAQILGRIRRRVGVLAGWLKAGLADARADDAVAFVGLLCDGGILDEDMRVLLAGTKFEAQIEELTRLVAAHAAADAELRNVFARERKMLADGTFATFEAQRARQEAAGTLRTHDLAELVAMLESVPEMFTPAEICGLARHEVERFDGGFDAYRGWLHMQRFEETWLDLYELRADGSIAKVESAGA
jgi:hypothetical protein